MSAVEIVHELREAGAVIEARGTRIHIEAPRGLLTAERRELLRAHKPELLALLEAVTGTAWTVDDLYAALSDEDRADLAAGDLTAEALRAFVHAVETRRMIEAGRVPAHFTARATCKRCGPVYLWAAIEVEGCPWCRNRIAGRPIPHPRSEPTQHASTGRARRSSGAGEPTRTTPCR